MADIRSLARPMKAHFLFFGFAALDAILVVDYTIARMSGEIDWSGPPIRIWHGHEMVFGFALAVMGGYFSGAMRGVRAPILGISWLSARMAFLFLFDSPWIMLPVLIAYPFLLFWYAGMPMLRAAKSWRNTIFGVILAAFPLAELLLFFPFADGWRSFSPPLILGIFLVSLMIFAMGGRIIAAATSGALRQRGFDIFNPAQPRLEQAGILILVSLIFATIVDSGVEAISLLSGGFAVIVIIRLWRWRFWCIRDASVLYLHGGYAWLAFGFLLMATAAAIRGLSEADILHAVTIGALGTLSLAIMTRIVLQRARKPMRPGLSGLVPIVLVNGAALFRITAPVSGFWLEFMTLSAIAWGLAFGFFLVYLLRRGLLANRATHR